MADKDPSVQLGSPKILHKTKLLGRTGRKLEPRCIDQARTLQQYSVDRCRTPPM